MMFAAPPSAAARSRHLPPPARPFRRGADRPRGGDAQPWAAFVIARYALAGRDDTDFWRDIAAAPIPDSLAERIAVFRATGNILFEPGDLFGPTNWYCVLAGQGARAQSWHPIADGLAPDELARRLTTLRGRVAEQLAELPPHTAYLKSLGSA